MQAKGVRRQDMYCIKPRSQIRGREHNRWTRGSIRPAATSPSIQLRCARLPRAMADQPDHTDRPRRREAREGSYRRSSTHRVEHPEWVSRSNTATAWGAQGLSVHVPAAESNGETAGDGKGHKCLCDMSYIPEGHAEAQG